METALIVAVVVIVYLVFLLSLLLLLLLKQAVSDIFLLYSSPKKAMFLFIPHDYIEFAVPKKIEYFFIYKQEAHFK